MTKVAMYACVGLALALIACSVADARVVNPPPWDAKLPNQTFQVWEFTQSPGPDPTISENPFGMAMLTYEFATWPDIVAGPEGDEIPTLHIDEDGGIISIWIANNPDPNLKKIIFWQVTSDKAPDPSGPVTDPPGNYVPPPYPQIQWPNGTWYTYNGLIEIPFNPEYEVITFWFPASTNIEEIAINTICIPEPATALFALVGLGLVRLRRR